MFQNLYIEREILDHPKTQALKERFPNIPHIACGSYQEIFNRKSQNFRLQKLSPSLILAKKSSRLILPVPEGYHLGGHLHFYFSHMLNCIFDCRYCFLQGMYRSANYVLFVNFEDFKAAIKQTIAEHPDKNLYFFSGYDCDSLALEPITQFAKEFLPFFSDRPKAYLELRTKSIQITSLLKHPVLANIIIAYTLSPDEIIKSLENKTPSLKKRLEALQKLQEKGWSIGLRFDPLIYSDDYERMYGQFFKQVFSELDQQKIHSITLGVFRLPKPFFKTISSLYPEEKLFAHSLDEEATSVSYLPKIKEVLFDYCKSEIERYVSPSLLFLNEAI